MLRTSNNLYSMSPEADVRDVAKAWTSAAVWALLMALESLEDLDAAKRYMDHAELSANMAEALCQDIGLLPP